MQKLLWIGLLFIFNASFAQSVKSIKIYASNPNHTESVYKRTKKSLIKAVGIHEKNSSCDVYYKEITEEKSANKFNAFLNNLSNNKTNEVINDDDVDTAIYILVEYSDNSKKELFLEDKKSMKIHTSNITYKDIKFYKYLLKQLPHCYR